MFFKCNLCSEIFSRKGYLNRHVQHIHENKPIKQYNCSSYNNHDGCSHNLPQVTENGLTRMVTKHAFRNAIRYLRIFPSTASKYLPAEFLLNAKPLIESTLDILKSEQQSLKISCKICVLFVKILDITKTDESYFSTNAATIYEFDLQNVILYLVDKIENFNKRGSNWKIDKTLFFEMEITAFK